MTKTILIFICVFMCIITFFSMCNLFTDGIKTVENQYKPSVLLKKYEYFKDLSASIDKKNADIQMYQNEISSMQSNDKDDKFYIQQRKSELLGIISIHNQLCAEYNTAMSKFNYSFCNKGNLPETNLNPLPREYKPYINKLN